VSTSPIQRERPVETVAGFLAAVSIFASLTAIFWHPLRLVVASIIVALIASGIGGQHRRLAGFAVALGGVCWFLGMVLAVVTSHPLW